METLKLALRWVLCIPVALAAGGVAMLASTFLDSVSYGVTVFAWLTSSAIAGAVAAYVAAYIAPSHKAWVAVVVSVLGALTIVSDLVIVDNSLMVVVAHTVQFIAMVVVTWHIFKKGM